MVKIFGVLEQYREVKQLYILILIYLIIGGVIVSFVMFGDIIIVELKVIIGFVGWWVIE